MNNANCVYCNSDRSRPDFTQIVDSNGKNNIDYFILCMNCGARGPVAHSAKSAWALWNKKYRVLPD